MPGPYTEKGSCRWKHDKGRASLDAFCSVCKEHARHSNAKLRNLVADGSINVKGVCHTLHPDNAPPPPKRTRRTPAEPVEQSKDERKVRAADREAKGRFVAGPSGEAKMAVERKNNVCRCASSCSFRRVRSRRSSAPSYKQDDHSLLAWKHPRVRIR